MRSLLEVCKLVFKAAEAALGYLLGHLMIAAAVAVAVCCCQPIPAGLPVPIEKWHMVAVVVCLLRLGHHTCKHFAGEWHAVCSEYLAHLHSEALPETEA